MSVSFYILSPHKAQHLLGFVTQLTQKALKKTDQSVLILVTDAGLLDEIDEALWTKDALSFIPHQRLALESAGPDIAGPAAEDSSYDTAQGPVTSESETQHASHPNQSNQASVGLTAPVILADRIPAGFTGIVINTTRQPVTDFVQASREAQPVRILEIIAPDEASVQAGRDKYKHYQQADYALTHYSV